LLQQRFNQYGAGAVSRALQMVGKQPGAVESSRSPNPPIVWRCFHRRLNCERFSDISNITGRPYR
jgi:hypothetical protein